LGIPVIVSEQYPKGLGHTAEEIQLVLPDEATTFEKSAFSSCGAVGLLDLLRGKGVSQVAICGIETHICVNPRLTEKYRKAILIVRSTTVGVNSAG
jgi:isochorismate hydrolase